MAGVSGVKGCGSPAIQAQSAPQERRRSRRWPAPCARQWCTSTLAPHPLSFYNAVRAWHPMMLLRGPWRRAAGVLAVAVALSCRAVQGQVRLTAGNPVASRSSRMASALAPKTWLNPCLHAQPALRVHRRVSHQARRVLLERSVRPTVTAASQQGLASATLVIATLSLG